MIFFRAPLRTDNNIQGAICITKSPSCGLRFPSDDLQMSLSLPLPNKQLLGWNSAYFIFELCVCRIAQIKFTRRSASHDFPTGSPVSGVTPSDGHVAGLCHRRHRRSSGDPPVSTRTCQKPAQTATAKDSFRRPQVPLNSAAEFNKLSLSKRD